MAYTWKIQNVQTLDNPNEKTVVFANFMISKDTASVTYAVELGAADADNFTPFADLTESVVIDWVRGVLGEERIAAMEAEVDGILATQQQPVPQSQDLPWVSAE